VVCHGDQILPEDLFTKLGDAPAGGLATLEAVERRHLLLVLERQGWVIGGPQGAAAILGLNASTLRSRMQKLGIQRP
jgi:transcriptional regulator with GAF, ATPase, and Fis domain